MKKLCLTIKPLDQYLDLYITKTQEMPKTSGSKIMLIKIMLASYLTKVSAFFKKFSEPLRLIFLITFDSLVIFALQNFRSVLN